MLRVDDRSRGRRSRVGTAVNLRKHSVVRGAAALINVAVSVRTGLTRGRQEGWWLQPHAVLGWLGRVWDLFDEGVRRQVAGAYPCFSAATRPSSRSSTADQPETATTMTSQLRTYGPSPL